ncbi:MAG: hypothetical protein KGJ86_10955 [Chloroflexota bacterium]|nr:hypothetical protein [Chloroflexota bacterium]
MRPPTFDELREFFRIDGWESDRVTDHDHWKKILPDGTTLRCHVSFAGGKSMGQDRWRVILRTQLHLAEDVFWEALRFKRPVRRPAPIEPQTDHPDVWMIEVLTRQLRMARAEAAQLTRAEASERIEAYFSSPHPDE